MDASHHGEIHKPGCRLRSSCHGPNYVPDAVSHLHLNHWKKKPTIEEDQGRLVVEMLNIPV